MEDNFGKCLEIILKHEGGYVNHPKDPGGITNLGITKRVYESWVEREVSKQEMKDLTPEIVTPIYKKKYWDRCHCDTLSAGLDLSVFDWAVNSGSGKPAKAVQKFVGATQDGVIGKKTLSLIANYNAKDIVDYLYDVRQKYYESRTTFEYFGNGWTKRNKHTYEVSLKMLG
jgi:lysozyme family protein